MVKLNELREAFGPHLFDDAGLILVDFKLEFGLFFFIILSDIKLLQQL